MTRMTRNGHLGPDVYYFYSPSDSKMLGFRHCTDVVLTGMHETTSIHDAYRRRGGNVAAGRTRAAAGEAHAASRGSDWIRGE